MLAVCKDVVIIKVVKDVAGYHMLLYLTADAGERDRSVIAGLELLSILLSHLLFSSILGHI